MGRLSPLFRLRQRISSWGMVDVASSSNSIIHSSQHCTAVAAARRWGTSGSIVQLSQQPLPHLSLRWDRFGGSVEWRGIHPFWSSPMSAGRLGSNSLSRSRLGSNMFSIFSCSFSWLGGHTFGSIRRLDSNNRSSKIINMLVSQHSKCSGGTHHQQSAALAATWHDPKQQRLWASRSIRIPTNLAVPQHYQYQVQLSPLPLGVLAVNHFSTQSGGGGGVDNSSRFPQGTPPPPPPNRLAQGAGLLGAASLLFGKTKYVLAALKVTKLASLGSMVVSIGAYSLVFGLPYAAGMVGLIFCHELGHLVVMMQRGMPFTPMVFVPFMGAVIAMKDHPRDAWEDALIAAGGPVAGTVAAGAVAVAAHVTDSQLLYALADFGFMINLFNLLPIGSLDGGRWVGALSKYVGVVGTGLGGYLAWTGAVSNPLFYLIWLAGGYETFQRFYNPLHLPPNFYSISVGQRAALTGGYFGLIVTLLAAMEANQRRKRTPEMIIREQGREPTWDATTFE